MNTIVQTTSWKSCSWLENDLYFDRIWSKFVPGDPPDKNSIGSDNDLAPKRQPYITSPKDDLITHIYVTQSQPVNSMRSTTKPLLYSYWHVPFETEEYPFEPIDFLIGHTCM